MKYISLNIQGPLATRDVVVHFTNAPVTDYECCIIWSPPASNLNVGVKVDDKCRIHRSVGIKITSILRVLIL